MVCATCITLHPTCHKSMISKADLPALLLHVVNSSTVNLVFVLVLNTLRSTYDEKYTGLLETLTRLAYQLPDLFGTGMLTNTYSLWYHGLCARKTRRTASTISSTMEYANCECTTRTVHVYCTSEHRIAENHHGSINNQLISIQGLCLP